MANRRNGSSDYDDDDEIYADIDTCPLLPQDRVQYRDSEHFSSTIVDPWHQSSFAEDDLDTQAGVIPNDWTHMDVDDSFAEFFGTHRTVPSTDEWNVDHSLVESGARLVADESHATSTQVHRGTRSDDEASVSNESPFVVPWQAAGGPWQVEGQAQEPDLDATLNHLGSQYENVVTVGFAGLDVLTGMFDKFRQELSAVSIRHWPFGERVVPWESPNDLPIRYQSTSLNTRARRTARRRSRRARPTDRIRPETLALSPRVKRDRYEARVNGRFIRRRFCEEELSSHDLLLQHQRDGGCKEVDSECKGRLMRENVRRTAMGVKEQTPCVTQAGPSQPRSSNAGPSRESAVQDPTPLTRPMLSYSESHFQPYYPESVAETHPYTNPLALRPASQQPSLPHQEASHHPTPPTPARSDLDAAFEPRPRSKGKGKQKD